MDAEVLIVGPAGSEDADALRAAGASVAVRSEPPPSIGPYDCAVVVHRPPAFDGIGLADRVDDRLPVVLYPAEGDERLAARAVAADVDRYVAGGPGDLVAAVEAVAGGRPDRRECGETAPARADGGTSKSRDVVPEGVEVPDQVPFELKERAMDEAPVGITITDPSLPDNPLIYVNDAFERMTGYSREAVLGTNCRFLQGEDTDPEPVARLREAIAEDRQVSVELVNYRKDGEKFWNQLEIAPLRDEDGEVTNYVGFQMDVTRRKRAEMAVERYTQQLDEQRATLERVLDRVDGLIEAAAETLVRATTRPAIEAEVCSVVADTDPYVGAWIGRQDLARDAVEVTATAGLDADVEGRSIRLDSGDLVAEAVRSGQPRMVESAAGAGDIHAGATAGTNAVAAVPLTYRDTCYGALVVYADDGSTLDDREASVLAALGRMVATAINAVETTAILTADDVLALEFGLRDPELFFLAVSARLDCALEYVGSVHGEDGSLLVMFDVDGAEGEAVVEAAAGLPGVADATVITDTEDATLVEFAVEEPSILTELADYGARTLSLSADGGHGRIRVEVPHESVARSVTALLTEGYDDTELLSYRELERPPTTKGEFLSELRDRLTDRQMTALRKAHVSGYYEWPRRTDGNDLAASMGVSRSTFHQHLRAAHRKLLAELFADLDHTS